LSVRVEEGFGVLLGCSYEFTLLQVVDMVVGLCLVNAEPGTDVIDGTWSAFQYCQDVFGGWVPFDLVAVGAIISNNLGSWAEHLGYGG